MANTYTQVNIHFVFAVRNRKCLIGHEWKDELLKYISGIVRNSKHKLLAINSMPDHVHMLVGLRGHQPYSTFMQDVKGCSSKWINTQSFMDSRFSWQEGYGAFACNGKSVPNVIKYIQNQETHHTKHDFIQEYRSFLETFEPEIDPRTVFILE